MELIIGRKYSFETYSGPLLGISHVGLTLSSIMDYNLARRLYTIDNTHAAILPNLPTGSPIDPANYNYYIFTDQLNNQLCMSSGWIKTESITEVTSIEFTIKVSGNSVLDIEKARKALVLAGLSNIEISS